MTKHTFKETKLITSAGEVTTIAVCEFCGATEDEKISCNPLMKTSGSYIEKALKAVARL